MGVYLIGFLVWVHPWEVIELSYLVFADDTKLFHDVDRENSQNYQACISLF